MTKNTQDGTPATGGIAERMRAARAELGLTVADMTARAGLRDRKTWERYERGETRPNSDTLSLLHDLGISAAWLVTGEGPMRHGADAPAAGAVPVIGLAECGLRGWYRPDATGLYAAAPPAVAGDPDAVAVIAVGDSMRPAGIAPGDLAFCRSGDPSLGDSVLIELTDGTLALKRWGGLDAGWARLSGWLPSEDAGPQPPFDDRRRADQVRRVRPVALTLPGLVRHLTPDVPSGQDLTIDDRLYEAAIRAALLWYDRAGLSPDAETLGGLVSRSVRMLRSRADVAVMTDEAVEAAVSQILTIARDMARSIPR